MFNNISFRYRQKAANGSSRSLASGGSPKAEVGEIDTRAPIQSVKAAVSLFGEVAFNKEKRVFRRNKAQSSESLLDKETQLVFAQIELKKLKDGLKNAETTKSRVLTDLDKANRTLQELNGKLKAATESKEAAVEATKAMKVRANQLEEAKSEQPAGGDESWKENLESARKQYKAISAELDAAKQELTKIRQDFDAALGDKIVAFEQAADAQFAAKANTERINELNRDIATIKESRDQIQLASEQAQKENAKIVADREAKEKAHKTAFEEAKKKLAGLKKEPTNPELVETLKEELAKTTAEVEALQEEMQKAHASDMETVKQITQELDDATKKLQRVAEEESSLREVVNNLRMELESVKKEHTDLADEEARTEASATELQAMLQQTKTDLETVTAEEIKAKEYYEETTTKLQQLSVETENAKTEIEQMRKDLDEFRKEAETARASIAEMEKRLPVAVRDAEDAKMAESIALDEIKILSERTNAARSSTASTSNIKLSADEFKSLSQKAEESESLVEMKLGAVRAQLEAIHASKAEAEKRIEANLKEIEELKTATDEAIKKAEMAEAAKGAIETELRKWRHQESKDAATEVSA